MQPTLVVNAGSSSLKVKLLPEARSATVERIGGDARLQAGDRGTPVGARDHTEAFAASLEALRSGGRLPNVKVVAHRVVHGGERYTRPTLLDADVESAIDELSVLAPLHNPANLEGVRAAKASLPDVPHVAVFDTGFHASLPPRAFLFGLPYELYEDEGIRRYGFHGPSHDYVTRRGAELMGKDRRELRMVSLHLGNGASAAAVAHGTCVDTTMGLTPLDGLLMGTRCGDLDPGVILHLLRGGRDLEDVDRMVNRRSGLLGLSGVSNDMRDVRAAAAQGNERAERALDVFGYRVRKTIGAMAAAMAGLDAIVFTGGIGEHDAAARADSVAGLEHLGAKLDPDANRDGETTISAPDSDVIIMVVPTDEERMMAESALEALGSAG